LAEAQQVTDRARNVGVRQWLGLVRQIRSESWGDVSGYLFILPMVVLYLAFSVWPIIRGLTMAFSDYAFLVPDRNAFNGLANFIEIAGDKTFWFTLGRSIYFTVLFVPFNIAIPLIIATLIASVKNSKAAAFYRVVTYLPVILPIAAALLLWRQMFDEQFGYINLILQNWFSVQDPPGWLSTPELAMPVTVSAVLWKGFGSNVLLYLVGLYNINAELYEAASIDGAGAFARWRFVTLPLLRPVFTIIFVFSAQIIGATQEPLIMFGGGGPENSVYTLGLYVYQVAFRFGVMRWGYAAAMSLIVGLIGMAMAAIVFRIFRPERLT
jgi:multiple sugar transport system permease protein